MKKAAVVIITVLTFLVAGGVIIGLSVSRKPVVQEKASAVKSFTDENFQTEVVLASRSRPVLVDFYADWCFPCRMLDPVLEEVARDLGPRAVIGKIDHDRNMIGRRFGVNRIPALFIIKDGEIKDAFYGVVPKEKLMKALMEFGT